MDIAIVSPVWFFGYDSIAELISMFITFFIGVYAYRIFKLSGQKKYKYLYLSFILLGIAFLAKSITNWIIYKEWVTQKLYIGKIIQLYALYNFGYLVHVVLALSAYMLLVLLLWDVHDRRVISLSFIFVIMMTILTEQVFVSFHIISFILLGFICMEFWKNARKIKKTTGYVVFAGFAVLMLSQLVFVFMNRIPEFYVAGEIVQLGGYLLLLVTLLTIFGKK